MRYVTLLMANVALLFASGGLVLGESGPEPALSMTCPAQVSAGDPIVISGVFKNTGREPLEAERVFVYDALHGLDLRVYRDGQPLKAKIEPLYERGRKQKIAPGEGWSWSIPLRTYFVFPEDEAGAYDVSVTHLGTKATSTCRFVIAKGSTKAVMTAITDSLPGFLQLTRELGYGQRRQDTHKILLRAGPEKEELLYWNDTPSFEGYRLIGTLPRDASGVDAKLVRVRLAMPRRFALDGSVWPYTREEEQRLATPGHEGHGILQDSPYGQQLEQALLESPLRELDALVVHWMIEGKLHYAMIGKFRPVPLLPKVPNDVTEEQLLLRAKLAQYDTLVPATEVPFAKKLTKSEIGRVEDGQVVFRVSVEGQTETVEIPVAWSPPAPAAAPSPDSAKGEKPLAKPPEPAPMNKPVAPAPLIPKPEGKPEGKAGAPAPLIPMPPEEKPKGKAGSPLPASCGKPGKSPARTV